MLDVGAGSGRDAAWFARRGDSVIAVELSAAMRAEARARHPEAAISWIDDTLPALHRVHRQGHAFHIILLNGVWQHVPPPERERAMRKLLGLLREGGMLALSLRHGADGAARGMHPVSLREAFLTARDLRARRRQGAGLVAGDAARGLGKLLVVAPDQENAKRYLETVRGWIPAAQARHVAQIATSDTPGAHEAVAAFRLRPEPSILVTVATAYEGLDMPEAAVVAALTHIRSRPWLEQMVARATRVDPNAGSYEIQRAGVPSRRSAVPALPDPHGDRAGHARASSQARPRANPLPFWLADELGPAKDGIVPLESNALALRFATLRPGPNLAMRRPEQEAAQAELLEAPSVIERRLRARLGELVAAQVVEEEAGHSGLRGGVAGPGLYYRYNAVLKRVAGASKSRAQMTLSELEAAIGWLERNRLSEHLESLDDDRRYAWSARKRRDWKPPVGRTVSASQTRTDPR